ncbi:flavodoxin family protein [Microbacterium sp. YY-01]|uniref:flavodoxin family protein n=1 Tax=Microbacterium sp. YY-01 TaxID=3421634 RepID=UPI003D1629F6
MTDQTSLPSPHSEQQSNQDVPLRGVVFNCSLKPSPAASSTDRLSGLVATAMAARGCSMTSVRVVDHDIFPGVERNMGEGDAWPELLNQILSADIFVFATPTWMGQHSSVAQRVLERLDAELAETDEQGRPSLYDKVAVPVVVGNEDGAHHIIGIASQSLSDVGFVIPAQAGVYWNGEAMHKVDFIDLDETPSVTQQTVTAAAANAVHLARLLKQNPFPASDQDS